MNKLRAFVRLDFVTIKPYFTVKNLLLYAAMALFLTTQSGSVVSGMGVGMMIGTLFMGYPFALSEKSNLDALYATLSVDRKTVVLGRYAFTLLLDAFGIAASLILGTAGTLTLPQRNGAGMGPGVLAATLALAALFLFIQSVQLPVYFKLGYSKAKLLNLIPFVAIMTTYAALLGAGNAIGGLADFFQALFAGGLAVPFLAAGLALALFVSYRLSIVLYRRRAF